MVKRHTSVNLNFRFIILKEALSIPNKINDVRKFLGKFDELLLMGGGGGNGLSACSHRHCYITCAGCLEVSFDGLQSCPQKRVTILLLSRCHENQNKLRSNKPNGWQTNYVSYRGSLTISKYRLHSQFSRSSAINSSIVSCLSIVGSMSPRRNGALYLKVCEMKWMDLNLTLLAS